MIMNKITNMAVVLAMLGLGILAACSDGDDVASSYSETNTGKPVAEWALSYIPGLINENLRIGHCESLAKSAVDDDEVVVDTGDVKIVSTLPCVSVLELVMKARIQVVDVDGNPVEGAAVSKNYCFDGDSSCLFTTGKDGYAYMGNQTYLTVGDDKPNYAITYKSFALRVFSSDSSLGFYGEADFSEATVVEVEGDTLVELKKVVLEPLYKVKVYLDSLYSENDEKALKRDDVCHDSWTKAMWDVLNETRVEVSRIDVEDNSSYVYPSYRITKENCKNGYVVLYGLPEGTYKILIDGTDYELPPLEVKP